MAQSKCPKCENTTFEQKVVRMVDGKTEYTFVQCAKCGTAIGVVDINSMKAVGNIILNALQGLRNQPPGR